MSLAKSTTNRSIRPRERILWAMSLLAVVIWSSYKELPELMLTVSYYTNDMAGRNINSDNSAKNNTDTASNNEATENDTTGETTTKFVQETTQDAKCKRMFEWSMMEDWKGDHSAIDFGKLPQTKRLSKVRMGGPSARGNIDMSIEVRNKKLATTVVDVRKNKDVFSNWNLWHRMIPEYASWVALQTAQRVYNITTDQNIFLFDCKGRRVGRNYQDPKKTSDLPPEWEKMGEISCDESIIKTADVIIDPPKDGLLWDLAWDMDFECHNSEMFKEFSKVFVDKKEWLEPLACFLSRQRPPTEGKRKVKNFVETIDMMKEIFPRVRVLQMSPDYDTDQTVDILYDCKVIFGIHGAGHMNAVFSRPGVAVVEMVGKDRPAYFRNVNMMLGQYYESIKADQQHGIQDEYFDVDLEEARGALLRAKEHALSWLQEHQHWR